MTYYEYICNIIQPWPCLYCPCPTTFDYLLTVYPAWFSPFFSRLHNKSVYFQMGLRKLVHRSTSKDLRQSIIVSPTIQKSKTPVHHPLPLHQSITVSVSIKKSNAPAHYPLPLHQSKTEPEYSKIKRPCPLSLSSLHVLCSNDENSNRGNFC